MMSDKVLKHFQNQDPILYQAIIKVGGLPQVKIRKSSDYFVDLVDSIISQQLSGKAASTIFNRFKQLFPNQQITPEALISLPEETLRQSGISYSKIKYLKDLASKVENQEIILKSLSEMTDEDVITKLTQVKGIGRWTAEMFLMFSLNRPDIFSLGDLGLKNALKKLYSLENPTTAEIETIVIKWKPYRSYASRILWKTLQPNL